MCYFYAILNENFSCRSYAPTTRMLLLSLSLKCSKRLLLASKALKNMRTLPAALHDIARAMMIYKRGIVEIATDCRDIVLLLRKFRIGTVREEPSKELFQKNFRSCSLVTRKAHPCSSRPLRETLLPP